MGHGETGPIAIKAKWEVREEKREGVAGVWLKVRFEGGVEEEEDRRRLSGDERKSQCRRS